MASKKERKNKQNSLPIVVGVILLIVGLVIPFTTYAPVVRQELNYQLRQQQQPKSTPAPQKPIDPDFSIIISKIGANTKVIKNVDPYDPQKYQLALTRGVAHAITSSLPNEPGNVFIFAHSAGNWYQANQYNAVFYLLNKLVKDDEIIIYYQGKDYHYSVAESKLVDNSNINYLKNSSSDQQLTLITCWPPGTTLKRQIVIAKLITSGQLPTF